jgi:hypothetical protein
MSEKKEKWSRTCNLCHQAIIMATSDENHYAVCTNLDCKVYGMMQISAEQMKVYEEKK